MKKGSTTRFLEIAFTFGNIYRNCRKPRVLELRDEWLLKVMSSLAELTKDAEWRSQDAGS